MRAVRSVCQRAQHAPGPSQHGPLPHVHVLPTCSTLHEARNRCGVLQPQLRVCARWAWVGPPSFRTSSPRMGTALPLLASRQHPANHVRAIQRHPLPVLQVVTRMDGWRHTGTQQQRGRQGRQARMMASHPLMSQREGPRQGKGKQGRKTRTTSLISTSWSLQLQMMRWVLSAALARSGVAALGMLLTALQRTRAKLPPCLRISLRPNHSITKPFPLLTHCRQPCQLSGEGAQGGHTCVQRSQ